MTVSPRQHHGAARQAATHDIAQHPTTTHEAARHSAATHEAAECPGAPPRVPRHPTRRAAGHRALRRHAGAWLLVAVASALLLAGCRSTEGLVETTEDDASTDQELPAEQPVVDGEDLTDGQPLTDEQALTDDGAADDGTSSGSLDPAVVESVESAVQQAEDAVESVDREISGD